MTEPRRLLRRRDTSARAAEIGASNDVDRDEPAALLRRSARGDEAAFARLYDLTAPTVHGIVRRVLRNPAQADEVTQEVYVEIWRTAARFDPPAPRG